MEPGATSTQPSSTTPTSFYLFRTWQHPPSAFSSAINNGTFVIHFVFLRLVAALLSFLKRQKVSVFVQPRVDNRLTNTQLTVPAGLCILELSWHPSSISSSNSNPNPAPHPLSYGCGSTLELIGQQRRTALLVPLASSG